MIIRISPASGRLVAYANASSKTGRFGNGATCFMSQLRDHYGRHLPLHDAICGVFAHSRRFRRLALKESKCPA